MKGVLFRRNLMASEDWHDLPDAPPGLAGESVEKGNNNRYVINVSNSKGYLCHIHMEVCSIFLSILII